MHTYNAWHRMDQIMFSHGVSTRPSLPLDPETEGLLALKDETLLKIDSIEIKFKNFQDLNAFWNATKAE
ncbi:hypothetical protein J7337_013151 [Fusarium musae]|uniref:Uncharacterized protein n=1 Tax=Fusarium musae TaxID=1042133 RepID=A0A9P8D436_9HYPO|nr:hypothetical protein J7337_013151 [Fusarium musae]KAG9494922.1 hypothetical protein J7337_013151 [Fusarium musae]